jgi:O-antigen ligase
MKIIIKICLWLLAFVPLVVDPEVFLPYTSGKNLWIQSCLILAGVLFLINYFYSTVFREELIEKATRYLKNPVVLSVVAFVLVSIVSTIFAVDKYSAFWGDLSRAEGLAGLSFYFAFFLFSLFIFEKRDWIWFFKLSLFTSLILFGKEFIEYFYDDITRPGSYTGNPIFLAGYLLFSISTSLIVLNKVKGWFFKYLSVITFILSVVGIFITQTRGTILGLSLGFIAILIYFVFKGKDLNYKFLNLRLSAIILLILGLIFSGLFIITRKNEIWQKVPGLGRVAITEVGDEEDPSTQIRLYLYKSSLKAVDPAENGWGKLLIGWGPENFILADGKYYYGEQYKYEHRWYDRTHNKFLDVLVMNGVFGLLAYLAIWVFTFKFLFKKSAEALSLVDEWGLFGNSALLFFVISYMTHLMFAFDVISTSISFFTVLAFISFLFITEPVKPLKKILISQKWKGISLVPVGSSLVIFVIFLNFIYFKSTLLGYVQMRNYSLIIRNLNYSNIENNLDSIFKLKTVSQMNIRKNFLEISNDYYSQNKNEQSLKLLNQAIEKAEEYVQGNPWDFRFMTLLADFYGHNNIDFKKQDYLSRGEVIFKKLQTFVPNRPDINRGLAVNLFYQKKYDESFVYFERAFDLSPSYFDQDKVTVEGIYTKFIQYFYEQGDKENFIKTAGRLRVNNYANMTPLDQIIQYLNAKGAWPNVGFK